MGRNIEDIIKEMPQEDQDRIEKRALELCDFIEKQAKTYENHEGLLSSEMTRGEARKAVNKMRDDFFKVKDDEDLDPEISNHLTKLSTDKSQRVAAEDAFPEMFKKQQ